MKNVWRVISLFILFIIAALVIFYFWASSSKFSEDSYNQYLKHENIEKGKNDSVINLMSYNIGYLSGMTNNLAVSTEKSLYEKNLDQILVNLKNTDADIIGIQEIDYNSKRSYHVDQHEEIASRLYPFSVKAVNWDKKYVPFPYWPVKVHFGGMLSGQSIMSKYPLEDIERIVLEDVASAPFYYRALYLRRLAQVVVVKHPIKDFILINIHAEAFDQETRVSQIKFLKDLVNEKAKTHPVVLLGDFNSDPNYDNSAFEILYQDPILNVAGVTDDNKLQLENTFSSDKPYERLDFIFYTKKDFIEIDSDVLEEYGEISDHLPVIAKLKFK